MSISLSLLRRVFVRSTLAAALLGCSTEPPPRTPKPDPSLASARGAIEAVLDDWHDAAGRADLDRYFSHLDDDAVFLGTDATERWRKAAFHAYAKPHFDAGRGWAFRAIRRDVVVDEAGAVAWFDEDLETQGLGPARGSGVLALRDGTWKILQYNLAVTVPNDRFATVKEAAGDAVLLQAAAGEPVDRLAWLAGSWVGTNARGERVEETWMAPSGGAMVGVGRSVENDKMVFFELLRVDSRGGKLVYVAQPKGAAPTEFLETASSADRIVFENRAHDWPKRIVYTRSDAGIDVQVEGDPGQPVDAWTMKPAVIARAKRASQAPAR